MIDFHAHILPGADHGSDGLETSKAQLGCLFKEGITRVVATPHFYPQRHSVDTFLERRDRAKKEILTLKGAEMPEVYLGAEVLVCGGIDHMEGIERLCIEGTDVILLEMPFHTFREEHYEAVYRIGRMGLRPVMAHVDRYPREDIARLCEECDVMCQINAEVLSGFGGSKRLSKLFDTCNIVAFGSDIHGSDKKAAKSLARLYNKTGDAGREVLDSSRALLSDAKNIFE
ncbi:MAG: hypothetical protein IJA52_08705 [Clostridia bacterium]|nr:hypothetical protein [Clostridia bacterium]